MKTKALSAVSYFRISKDPVLSRHGATIIGGTI